MKRNPDGTYRNARRGIVVSDRMIVARWVSDEILRCKRTGLSMAAIAVHVTRVGKGEDRPLATLPDGIVFPPDYRISESAVYKAYHKAMDLEPTINAEVYRKEDTARCEDMFMNLQRGISAGDPRSVDAGVRVLAHKAKLNGYTVEPEQVSAAGGFQINIHLNAEREED